MTLGLLRFGDGAPGSHRRWLLYVWVALAWFVAAPSQAAFIEQMAIDARAIRRGSWPSTTIPPD